MQKPIAIAIHGGAGTLLRSMLTPDLEARYHAGLKDALTAGHLILTGGGTALDAVAAAIVVLEDNPLFNAGKGAVYTHDKTHELDASIMCGATLEAGAVAGVSTIKNPMKAALAVLQHSQHVLLTGEGAEAFAATQGLETAPQTYFDTDFRYQQLLEVIDQEGTILDHTPSVKANAANAASFSDAPLAEKKFGTVGAVALDSHGNIAAGTSTGGMTNKRFRRVGDTPIIGAGTYANNATCAISATGHGEFFMRYVVAYDIAALMAYKGLSLQAAADEVIMHKLQAAEPDTGGIIGIDAEGNIALVFNTAGMYRGSINTAGEMSTAIYK